jgi:hypothetical protein
MADPTYTREALIRDVVNAVSQAQKKPINLGGQPAESVNRAYILEVLAEVTRVVGGGEPEAY